MSKTTNQINNPTDDNTILVSRITLGQALLEALNPVQVRLTWTLMLSSIDALSDQTAIAFRDRLFALLSDFSSSVTRRANHSEPHDHGCFAC